ncbi:hypothetical protein OF117_04860 [Geodermatophilus sp. YIM 151500]|uniref:hypothetical protein n=1 Tax=Geodermatophilus sp. YIM 151500 TaxID=2984531 RepID=UPI0021E4D8C0|nr:hypothetical protein [Geodermatophilus sp. YIM 151500]MCV2488685.1 hypothetical protein [Geodermatophilus sp. YIM 151500]
MAGDGTTSAFAGDPQPVEVYHRGIWYLGELLGWRHEGDGRCLARVRCVVDGLRHSAWKDLADLRLPEPIGVDEPATDDGDDDDTRPHVLLADLRTRPRPPAHALVPPPRWVPAAAGRPDPRPGPGRSTPRVTTPQEAAPQEAAPHGAGPYEAAAPQAATGRRGDGRGDWSHLRRGSRLSRV